MPDSPNYVTPSWIVGDVAYSDNALLLSAIEYLEGAIESATTNADATSKVTKVENIANPFVVTATENSSTVIIECNIEFTEAQNTDFKIASVDTSILPAAESYATAVAAGSDTKIVTLTTTGDIMVYKPAAKSYYFSLVYAK